VIGVRLNLQSQFLLVCLDCYFLEKFI
jgi:hypothetical protein